MINEYMETVKTGLRNTTINAVSTLSKFVDPEENRGIHPKLQLEAAKTIVNTVFKMQGILTDGKEEKKVTNNIMQVNTQASEAGQEVFNRVVKDISSITPVATTVYNEEDGDDYGADTDES